MLKDKIFDNGYLKVSNLHEIYYQQCGNPKGIPVVYIYGGPGGWIKDSHRDYFDLQKFRLIQYEQRGCGLSKPQGEVRENTFADLVDDLEKLRKHLKIDKWLVVGTSWGSTIALSYGEKFTYTILGLIVQGILLGREWDLKWFPERSLKTFFPELFDELKKLYTKKEIRYYPQIMYSKFLSLREDEKFTFAMKNFEVEERMSVLEFQPLEQNSFSIEEKNKYLNSFKIYAYFVSKKFFLNNNQILLNAGKLNKIPYGAIINGRYDMVCPPKIAYKLHKKWTRARFIITESSGHLKTEPNTIEVFKKAINDYKI